MISLTHEQIKEYKENGYLILRNVIDLSLINQFTDFVSHIILLETDKIEIKKQYTKDEILNDLIIKIKKMNPSSSSWIYQTILNSFALKEFFIKIDISKLAMDLLEIQDRNNLGSINPAFRFDIPGDSKNIRTWHQDSNYFLENEKGHEHLVTWIPLNEATKENGSVILVPKSHLDGKLNSNYEISEEFKSEQFTTDEKYFNDTLKEIIIASPGDIAFINMDLIHSSGTNITENSVRYTAQIRFNTINKDSYRPAFTKIEYPIYSRISNLIK